MKLEDNNSNIEEVNWKYIPNIYQILEYLPHSGLIQLSSTCKHLRLKLKSKCISRLDLMRGGKIVPGKPNKPSKKKQLISLFDILEEDYLDRYNNVNHCVFWEFFNSEFARNFFSLFSNITRLELYSSYYGDYYDNFLANDVIASNGVLFKAIYPLKNLEILKIRSSLINTHEPYSKLFLKLPLSLKIIFIIQYDYGFRDLSFYPMENINGEYSNLKKVSIINSRMLNNMTTRMKSLIDVTISSQENLSTDCLIQFLLLNHQLKKLSIPGHFLKCRLANSILKMQQLKRLDIIYSIYGDPDVIDNPPANTSIEHLNITCNTSTDILIPFLNNLKSLKVLEFSKNSLYNFMQVSFSTCTNIIPLLHLNSLEYDIYDICIFNNSEIFDRIKLTNLFNLDYYLANYEGDNLKNWDIYHINPINSKEYTLINKNLK
jgi:hypothetical protein